MPHGGALGHPPSPLERRYEQLSRLVLVLLEPAFHVRQHRHPQGPEAVGRVGEMGACQKVHQRSEEHHAQLTVAVPRLVHAQAPGGHNEVGLVSH